MKKPRFTQPYFPFFLAFHGILGQNSTPIELRVNTL